MKPADYDQRNIKIIINNKRARHDYEVMRTLEAGIVLQGTEVKSLRQGKSNVQDAYATFPNNSDDELFLLNFHIAPYDHGNRENHESKRPRKLLVTHREAVKLRTAVMEKGLTLIPLKLYFSGPYVKVELGLVRARKKYDKREALKERDTKKDISRHYRV